MLTFHDTLAGTTPSVDLAAGAPPAAVNWIDALAPTAEEIAALNRALGVATPTLDKMSEIESSSRLYRAGETLYLTLPLAQRETDGESRTAPLAFVLTPAALLTVRYEPLKACDSEAWTASGQAAAGSLGAFITLAEVIVDHLADELEWLIAALDKNSQTIFAGQAAPIERRRRPSADDLRRAIVRLGHARGFTGHVGETLLSLARMVPYVASEAGERVTPEARARLDRLARDVASLSAHESRLSEKIQFLLDASLGLIGVEQNDIFRLLTIVSVIGIPPTFFASMYGMNFKTMPEYDWAYGYEYGLAVIVLSALAPLAWFKWKRWF
jgi:magnesium transporter